MKFLSGTSRDVPSSRDASFESPTGRSSGAAIAINEQEDVVCGMRQSGKRMKSLDGESSGIVTSTSGLTTKIRLLEIDAMI